MAMTKEQKKDKKELEGYLIEYLYKWGSPFTVLTYTIQNGLKESINASELQAYVGMMEEMYGSEVEEVVTEYRISKAKGYAKKRLV